MRISNREITLIISALDNSRDVDASEDDAINKEIERLCVKLSKELKRRGFTSLISRCYLKQYGGMRENEMC